MDKQWLMSIFFFIVGLELKRDGRWRVIASKSNLPIFAALGGMVIPLSIYLLFNQTGEAVHGWGFNGYGYSFAIGVLFLRRSSSSSLKVFLNVISYHR